MVCHECNLTIQHTVPPNPLLANVVTSGPPVAGLEFSMNCVVYENITGLNNMPTATWLDADDTPLTTGNDITITSSQNETVAVTTLKFNPLRASHGEGGEVYRCVGNLMSPAPTSLIEVDVEEVLIVQSKLLYYLVAYVLMLVLIHIPQSQHQLRPSI